MNFNCPKVKYNKTWSSVSNSGSFFGVVLVPVLVVLVTGVKQSQLLVLRLRLEFDKNKLGRRRAKLRPA